MRLQCLLAAGSLPRANGGAAPAQPVRPHAGSGGTLSFTLSEDPGWKTLRSGSSGENTDHHWGLASLAFHPLPHLPRRPGLARAGRPLLVLPGRALPAHRLQAHPGRRGGAGRARMFFSSVSLAPHPSALMAGTPTSVTPTQPVGYAAPSVGSPGVGPQRRTCPRERKVGRKDQRRRALPAQVELITQVRRPQSGPR